MDVHEAIRNRRSVRAFSARPIPKEIMHRMRDALRFAPSACNLQPWRFILVMQTELRRGLAEFAKGQAWMGDAPVTVVACSFPQQAYRGMGGYGNSADLDVTIALDHLTLAAVAEGLGSCWIGAFDEASVKELLDIPETAKVVAMIPLGYPASAAMIHPLDESQRKSPAEVFSIDCYGSE